MKVLQINANYGFGSTGLIMQDIGNMLQSNGHQAQFAYQRTNAPVTNGYTVGTVLDWKCHAVLSRILGRQGFYSSLATKKLLRHLDAVQPDVVHLHNLHSNYVKVDMLLDYLGKKDIPTVITMHDCWYFTGKCFHYADVGCEKFQTGCGNCPKKKAPPKSLLLDASRSVLRKKVETITAIPRLALVGCSQWIVNQAQKSLLHKCRMSCIYNGVDTDIFRPKDVTKFRESLCAPTNFLIMAMANKLLLPENCSIIPALCKLPNTKLMVVGCKKEQLQMLSSQYPEVLGVGFISDRNQLADYYNAADVFINMTHADTLPTVNMESICCGTPVITYDSCGSPELVPESCGYVVKQSNQTQMLEAIKAVQEKPFPDCHRYGKKRYNKDVCYRQYLDLYEILTGRS